MREFPGLARWSIRRRLLVPLCALFIAAMLVLYVAARGYGRQAADTSYDHLLQASVLSMTDSLQLVQGAWHMDMPYAALEVLSLAANDRVFYRVTDGAGRVLTGYPDLPAPPRLTAEDQQPALFDATYSGELVRFAVLRHEIAGPESNAVAIVQVGQTRLARDALASDIVWRATLIIGMLTLAVLALVWVGVHRSLRPVARVEKELLTRQASELRAIESPVPRELVQLVAALNGFMARLSGNLDTLRVFIADAAHQLRTPLAALRAQVQVALDEDDPAEQRRSLVAVDRNAARLTRLVNQLLSDASVNHRSSLQRFERLDAVELVRDALQDVVPQADPHPDVIWHCALAQAPLQGDALMLREAVKNLIDNALKHGSPDQTAVVVTLDRDADAWRLTIDDQGPGIPPAQAQTIFDRFVRGAGTRASGAGLGLSIVRRVVEGHRGTIALTNRVEGGLRVSVRLPAA